MYAALAIAATLLAAPGYDEAKAAVLADYASYSKIEIMTLENPALGG